MPLRLHFPDPLEVLGAVPSLAPLAHLSTLLSLSSLLPFVPLSFFLSIADIASGLQFSFHVLYHGDLISCPSCFQHLYYVYSSLSPALILSPPFLFLFRLKVQPAIFKGLSVRYFRLVIPKTELSITLPYLCPRSSHLVHSLLHLLGFPSKKCRTGFSLTFPSHMPCLTDFASLVFLKSIIPFLHTYCS